MNKEQNRTEQNRTEQNNIKSTNAGLSTEPTNCCYIVLPAAPFSDY